LTLSSVIQALTVFYSVLGVSLFIPVVAGIHSRRPGVPEALAAVGAGVLALTVAALTPEGPILPWLTPSALGLLWSAAAFFVWHAVRRGLEGRTGRKRPGT